ncbi:hypothetical protein CRG98_030220 [Punica granatum]|uniref:Uncharacterized protein n=1 Tax=Punica granatum TaxID=22663 RepID=A0A2I0J102_PUNGR|nr:hypothetical protein CRG98_030220 [Punica granatum]
MPGDTTYFEAREPLVIRGGHGTRGHASRKDGREFPRPSRTHRMLFRPEVCRSPHFIVPNVV